MIKLLIVVPTLNSYKILPKLVKSLEKQTYKNWKLLFIDGNSHNEHRLWLESYCKKSTKATWTRQNIERKGIFGAMSQGFTHADIDEWLLFWGSDDWANNVRTFEDLVQAIDIFIKKNCEPHLVICKGTYINMESNKKNRSAIFINSYKKDLMDRLEYKKQLFLGSIPPHQSTLIGPKARVYLNYYSDQFQLAGDLNYFLQIANLKNLQIQLSNIDLVKMSSHGISSKMTMLRLKEVINAYRNYYKYFWLIPFLMRYLKRLTSKLVNKLK